MAIRILEIDRPTNKGTIYPRVLIEAAIERNIAKIKVNQVGIFRGVNIVKEDMIGVAKNLRIEEGYMVADIKLVDTWVKEMVENGNTNFCLRPIGHGTINPETGEIEEGYAFYGLTVRMSPASYEKN